MRAAPAFWGEKPGLAADLLAPLAVAWDAVARLRHAVAQPYRAAVPVLCVGNLVAGGAGKTPVVLSLCAELARCGVVPHVVTRGYGGHLAGPVRVDPMCHDSVAVGDEALLLAARAACWVARRRAAGLRAAATAGARIILLDDGFQNPSIAKTVSLVVVDAEYGFGNGRVMPAGPLRERLCDGLSRADAIVLVGGDTETGRAVCSAIGGRVPIIPARIVPLAGERFRGERLLAFAGIAQPGKFFASLAALGAELTGTRGFPDHHRFRPGEIAALREEAERAGARLVTTAKDIVRLPVGLRTRIEVLDIEIGWPEPDLLDRLLAPVLGSLGNDSAGE
jgi:tetraacyldisaccharide 4'-kinase